MRSYEIPVLKVSRLSVASVHTVSTNEDWKDEWDEALEEETDQA